MLDSHFHNIDRVDRADDAGPCKRPLSVHDAGRLEIRHDREILPYFALEAGLGKFLAQDCIRFAHSLQPVACDGSRAAHAESRSRERLTIHHAVRQAKCGTDNTHLIFIEKLNRLHELKLQILRKTSDIVVRFDTCIAFQNIRINSSLSQESDSFQLGSLLGKDIDKLFTDNMALLLRIADSRQFIEEAVNRIDIDQIGAKFIAENLDDLLGLSFSEQSVIDMHTDQLIADRLNKQGRAD